MTNCRRPLASDRKIMSRVKLLFRTVGQALSLTDLIIVRLNPDLRGPKRSSVLNGPAASSSSKRQTSRKAGTQNQGPKLNCCGSLVAEGMLAVVLIAA